MLNQQQLTLMLKLQGRMNSAVTEEWVARGFPFLRAVVVEGAEGIGHTSWKWWKAEPVNVEQLRLELVDILHFVLSDSLMRSAAALGVARADGEGLPRMVAESAKSLLREIDAEQSQETLVFDRKEYAFASLSLIDRLELMVGLAVSRRYSLRLLLDCWRELEGSMNDLFTQYTAKNVLNVFRQDMGYKRGTYIKIWDGREDNEHLAEIMATLSPTEPTYEDLLMAALRSRYPGRP